MPAERTSARNRQALLLGFLGVVIFGLTLPATRLAVADFDPLFVTAGRSLVAAALASLTLLWARSQPPLRREWPRLAAFAAFSIVGFPLLMAIAMQYAPASHGAVVLAVLPLLTAMGGALVAGERPSLGFWACGVAGTGAVLFYSLLTGGASGDLHWADLLLAASAVSAAMAYALGGEMARRIGGWEVLGAGARGAGDAGALGVRRADQLGCQRVGLGRLSLCVRVQHVLGFLRLEQGDGDGRHRQDRTDPAVAAVRCPGRSRSPPR
jgi:drug/metabolite transporter (DMT)-like permease